VEDVGSHRIVRAAIGGREIAAVLPEGAPVSDRAEFMRFRAERVNVYADGWRVEGAA
jgi:glycerol transport system ATP-binding protein